MPDPTHSDRAVAGVLLQRADNDPRRLMGDPSSIACQAGARPPTALRHPHEGTWHIDYGEGTSRDTRALVLAWCREVVLIGCHIAYPGGTEYLIADALRSIIDGDLSPLWRLRLVLEGRGSLVLVDADGREVYDRDLLEST